MGNFEPSFQARIYPGTANKNVVCAAFQELLSQLAGEFASDNFGFLDRGDYSTQIVLEILTGTNTIEQNADALHNIIADIQGVYPGGFEAETLEPPLESVPDQAPLRHFMVFERASGNVPSLVLNVASEGEALNFFAREAWQSQRLRVDLRDFHAVEYQQPSSTCILLQARKVNPTIPSEQPRPDEPPSRAPPGASKQE